jgi:hypothetical protein
MHSTARLSYLLELADKGPAMRTALAEEVAELLLAWPADYPTEMRGICETLLTRAARELDPDIRARLRIQLCADTALTQRVLPREAEPPSLIVAARMGEQLTSALAGVLHVTPTRAADILADTNCVALATAAKGARLDRLVFSTLAMLTHKGAGRAELERWDAIDLTEADDQLQAWRNEALAAAA